jgi:hypothetical protein
LKKILNITHLGLDGALCAILLQRKFFDQTKYKLTVIPITANRTDNLIQDCLNDYCNKYDMIYITGLTPSAFLVDKLKGTKIISFIRYGNGVKPNTNCFVNRDPELTTADMIMPIVSKEGFCKQMANMITLTKDYELYTLKHRASMGLNFLFKGKYKFEEYIERFKDGYDGFNAEEKTVIFAKEAEVKKTMDEVKTHMFCGCIDGMNISMSPIYEHPNEMMKYMFDLEPYSDMTILLNLEKRFGSVRVSKTAVNKPMHNTLEVFLSTFVARSARASGNAGNFSWIAGDESDNGLPTSFLNFLKWNEKLGIHNFDSTKEVDV